MNIPALPMVLLKRMFEGGDGVSRFCRLAVGAVISRPLGYLDGAGACLGMLDIYLLFEK